MGSTRTTTQTKTASGVKSSVAGSTRDNSSMPSMRGSVLGGGGGDGNDDDDLGDDDKKKKKKDHCSSTDSSDSDEKDKKKKQKKSNKKKKRSKKSLSRDRKVKKKGNKSWGAPDDGRHPWDRREESDLSRIPGPSDPSFLRMCE
eukprot:1959528-Amphidinium_carterae.3